MILDDGGDATLLLHLGARAEKDEVACSTSRRARRRRVLLRRDQGASAGRARLVLEARAIKGVTEETTTGVHRLYQMAKKRHAALPGDQRQRLGHQVEVRQPLRLPRIAGRRHQARHRRDDRRQGRGGRGYGDVGKGSAAGAARAAAPRVVTEIDPICALQAAMEGYEVVTMEDAADKADIFVTATGNKDVITARAHARDEGQAIVCNIGHFDNEIDIAALEELQVGRTSSRRSTTSIFPDGKRIILLAEGRLVNLGCATGHPSFVMSNSFTNQTLAQIELFTNTDSTRTKVYVLPKHLDEKVARLHLEEARREADRADRRAGRLHRRAEAGPVQATAHQICVFTAFSLVPRKRLMRRCCLIHLKNSSTCQRLLYSAAIVSAGSVVLLVRKTSVLPDSGSLKRTRRRCSG
jgi:adenosylhomocysteinase